MAKCFLIAGVLVFLVSVRVSYATNGKPHVTEQTEAKKQACKTSEKLIPEKLLKIRPLEIKPSEKPQSSCCNKTPSAANTFETLITPFLKAVAPHFYDQIIKKEQKPASAQS